MDPRIKINSVVQISPEFMTSSAFRCCMATVREIDTRRHRLMVYVQNLGDERSEQGGQTYIFLTPDDCEYVGEATWVAE